MAVTTHGCYHPYISTGKDLWLPRVMLNFMYVVRQSRKKLYLYWLKSIWHELAYVPFNLLLLVVSCLSCFVSVLQCFLKPNGVAAVQNGPNLKPYLHRGFDR